MTLQLFDKIREQPLVRSIAECRELVEDADSPTVRCWREAGGKDIGHFQVYIPEGITKAAGMLPQKFKAPDP